MNTRQTITTIDASGGIVYFRPGLRALIDTRDQHISKEWVVGDVVDSVRDPELAYMDGWLFTVAGKGRVRGSLYEGNTAL